MKRIQSQIQYARGLAIRLTRQRYFCSTADKLSRWDFRYIDGHQDTDSLFSPVALSPLLATLV
jgi:hypothetical protein